MPWQLWMNRQAGYSIISSWVFVLYVWDVCCCGDVPRLPHSLITSSCCARLVWHVLVGTCDCWILCSVCFWWLLRPLLLCVIACCRLVHCCWPSLLFGCVVSYAPCVLLTSDCWLESFVVISSLSYPPSGLLGGAPSELVGCFLTILLVIGFLVFSVCAICTLGDFWVRSLFFAIFYVSFINCLSSSDPS